MLNLDYGQIGEVEVSIGIIDLGLLNIGLKSDGDATSGPYTINQMAIPMSATIGSSSSAVASLLNDLSTRSDLILTSDAPIIGDLLTVVDAISTNLLAETADVLFDENGWVTFALTDFVDPLLSSLGIGIGEIILVADAINERCYDFGDAPNLFGTTKSSGGPIHVIDTNIYLGTTAPGSSVDASPDPMADSDLADDGIISFSSVIENDSYVQQIFVTNNSGKPARVVGWIDFNGNNMFDANERSELDAGSLVPDGTSGLITLTWLNLSPGSSFENKFSRFRISTDPILNDEMSASPWGMLSDGEVEDYYIAGAPLPIILSFFDVSKSNKDIKLYWKTHSEINASGFEIQRSLDGRSFSNIGWVNSAQSNQTSEQSYAFLDRDFTGNEIYYRLKMVDLDGHYEFSEIRKIVFQSAVGFSLQPNPCHGRLTVKETTFQKGSVVINIYNQIGNLLFSQKETVDGDSVSLTYDVSQLPNGSYIVEIQNENSIQCDQLVILNQ